MFKGKVRINVNSVKPTPGIIIRKKSAPQRDLRTANSQSAGIVQLIQNSPSSLVPDHIMMLQRTIGNSSLSRIIKGKKQSGGFHDSLQKKPNNTGLPDNLKSGIEGLSGYSMDDVKVHYNSDKPAQLNALAYTQGTDIHVASGQEKHLPHEAWHVVQQKEGRAKPTILLGNTIINNDASLEQEANSIEAKTYINQNNESEISRLRQCSVNNPIIQRRLGFEFETGYTTTRNGTPLTKKTPIGMLKGGNWKTEADDGGRMEFIIYPPLEINQELPAKINAIFDQIDAFCAILQNLATQNRTEVEEKCETDDDSADEDSKEYNYNQFSLQEVTNSQNDAFIMILPNSNEIAANPQVTTGLTLDQLFNLTKHDIGDCTGRWPIKGAQGKIEVLSQRFPATLTDYGLDQNISDKLKGLLTITTSYLQGGNQQSAFQYPKELTDSYVLSRTKISQLFNRITHAEKVFFKQNPAKFVQLALYIANLANTGATQLLTPGVTEHGINKIFGPTRQEWLLGITVDTDLLAKAVNNEFESMGELGDKTEYVGGSSGNLFEAAGIFEIRAGQTRSLEYEDWRTYANDLAQYIMKFQKDNHGLLSKLNKDK